VDYLKDYIEVKDRIKLFYAQFPEGTLHFQYKGVLELNGETFIYGEAFAYPERDKMAYASGWAWERVPARGFAKGAEMMTLETSAWGQCYRSSWYRCDKRYCEQRGSTTQREPRK
jgi:hypothetical protein